MTARRPIDRVGELAREDLASLGFRKRKSQIYTLDLDFDVIGWLGLNHASEHQAKGVVEVNPVVGIRHQGVERMVADLQGNAFHPYLPPTISQPLGYLMPAERYVAWTLDTGSDRMAKGVREMVDAIREHGLSFMRANSDLRGICSLIERRLGFDHQLVYRRPVAWFLAGNVDRAHAALQESIEALGDRRDPAAEQLRQFAPALESRLG